jgi:hypothetical protein
MKTKQEIAQWVIDNRYPKSENNKVSDFEMYHTLIEEMNQLLIQPVVKSVCTCIAFHKNDECYEFGCKVHRSNEVEDKNLEQNFLGIGCYSIKIDSVSEFRKELMKMIEQVRYNIGEYKDISSSQVAEKFEQRINSER